jgi:hypothetical protein
MVSALALCLVQALLVVWALATALPAYAADVIDHAQAQSIFRQAKTICTRDRGALWGRTLCGPILLVDPESRSVVTNQADAGGVLQRSGSVFIGILPPSEPIADTPISWSGTRWTELLWPWPMREDPDMRHVTLAHELFHRIQHDELHLVVSDGDNTHLDTLDGRYLIELEWKALAAALQAPGVDERRAAIADAILFRHERYRLYPAAARNESVLESNEGIAEYTGVKLGLKTPAERIRYAVRDLSTWSQAPSFVRSFAYATGPAYGLLLDQAEPGWLKSFMKNQQSERFDQRLSNALRIPEPDLTQLHARAAVYDSDGSLHANEAVREKEKQVQLVEFKTKLIEGPVLSLPLANSLFEFKPGSIVPLEDIGKVYPTITLHDDWGTLTVESGGALVRNQPHEASVSAAGFDVATLHGLGYTLSLVSGWSVQPGTRAGDLVVRRDVNAAN